MPSYMSEKPGAATHLPFRASGSFLRPAYDIGRDVNIVDDQIDIEFQGRLAR